MKLNILIACCLLAAAPLQRSAGALEVPKGAVSAVLSMPDGGRVEVELALTQPAQAKGLMFRTELADDRGMLFAFSEGGVKTFWMKNTLIPLDIVFLDKDMTVMNIFHRVPKSVEGQPESEVAKVSAPAWFVLELPAGKARKCGLTTKKRIKTVFAAAKKAAAAPAKK